jgi:hypothetical protein
MGQPMTFTFDEEEIFEYKIIPKRRSCTLKKQT